MTVKAASAIGSVFVGLQLPVYDVDDDVYDLFLYKILAGVLDGKLFGILGSRHWLSFCRTEISLSVHSHSTHLDLLVLRLNRLHSERCTYGSRLPKEHNVLSRQFLNIQIDFPRVQHATTTR